MERKNAAAAAEAESILVETVAQETEGRSKKRSSKDDNQRCTAAAWKLKANLLTLQRMRPKDAPRSAAAKKAIYGVVLLISSIDVRTGGRLHPVEVTTKRNAVSVIRHAHIHS